MRVIITMLTKGTFLAIVSALLLSTAQADTINFMAFNIACLPSGLGIQINGKFLRPNIERVNEIINVVDQWNANKAAPNIIAFEEAFDPNVRTLIKDKLGPYYPYNSGDQGQKPFNAGSGLLLLSQYPILDIQFFPYKNIMLGDETLANKGFILAKLKYNDNYFITAVITHLESGDAILKNDQSKYGTTSYRRGVQMGYIADQIQENASVVPAGHENLKYLKTFVLGDFNAPLNNEREQKSISTGMSNNGFHKGEIKYPGQYHLFTLLENTVPTNFFETRILPDKKGDGKTVNPDLLKQAVVENKFTGSTMHDDVLTINKDQATFVTRQQSEYEIIDGIFASHDGINGNMQSEIRSLNEISQYKYEMSDHFTLWGTFTFQP